MIRKISILAAFTLLVTGGPLLGAFLSGLPAAHFLSFPPLTRPSEHAPFSWPVFMIYLLPAIGTLILVIAAARKTRADQEEEHPAAAGHFPWWGRLGCGFLLICWFLAWSRMPWFEALQPHTFIPLWLSYIVIANALCFRQSGGCPLLDTPVFFLALFPASAAFWWYFEYLNQFVHSWYYTGVDYGPLAYSIHASLSFSTVLPAVYTTRTLIAHLPWLRQGFHGLPPLRRLNRIPFAAPTVLAAGFAGLVALPVWPDTLFSLLWIAPLLILTALQHMAGQASVFSGLADGDWRPVLSAAAAALVCGFFWEMWNYCSMAKWMYSIPYVYRFKVFEMPILGYMGYLPFGLECIAITELFAVRRNPDRER
jgi:hypothetical protein